MWRTNLKAEAFKELQAQQLKTCWILSSGIFIAGFESTRKQQDPWDVYDYLQETIVRNSLDSIFFFFTG